MNETGGNNNNNNNNYYRPFPRTNDNDKNIAKKKKNRGLRRQQRHRYSVEHRGFSTPIVTGLFRDPGTERIDACSIACCGCLQADRNRFLVTGTPPPGLGRRACVHAVIPAGFFGTALFVAFHVPDPFTNNVLCWAWFVVLLFYLVGQCDKGSWKRRDVRRNLLWAKHKKITAAAAASSPSSPSSRRQRPNKNQSEDFDDYYDDDDSDDDDDDDDAGGHLGQSASDIRNASACCCGWYAVDDDRPGVEHEHNGGDDDNTVGEEEAAAVPCLARAIGCLASVCCGRLCGRYLVCCGFCSVAQEGREIETLVRPGVLAIDYVTMQPVMEYYPSIYAARHGIGGANASPGWWWNRLSGLSRKILWNAAGALAVLLAWSLLSDRLHHGFGVGNFVVLVLTLLQSLVLLLVVGRCGTRTDDVSLDALIKFFASGFCLSTTLAIGFELVLGLILRFGMAALMLVSGIEAVEENGYAYVASASAPVQSSSSSSSSWKLRQDLGGYGGGNYRDYLTVYGNEHPWVYTVYLFVVSFLLAAAIEETCKYLGYRMVGDQHPDFATTADLDEALACHEKKQNDGDDGTVSFREQDRRSLVSRGAAITLSMVTVGAGFACCENLVYVFLYGKAALSPRIGTLLARSVVPVHPVAAALQSVRVCERDLEGGRGSSSSSSPGGGLVSVVTPGVVLHGLFDFALVWLEYLGSRKGRYVGGDDDDIDTENGSARAGRIASSGILLLGFLWCLRESRKQNERLAALDARRGIPAGGGAVPADSGWPV